MSEKKVKRIAKEREMTCIDCGTTFKAFSPKALRCSECKRIHNNEASRERDRANRIHSHAKPLRRSKAERGEKSVVPMCPFWGEKTVGYAIVCENGTITQFETKKEKYNFITERCGRNPEWMNCPIAKEILATYERK